VSVNVSVPLVRMEGIRKRFGEVIANDGVTFDLRAGEVHTLLGENGAGKSTLMNILSGLYRPDGGTILIDGKPVDFRSPRDALARGVGMVHQHFMLLKGHTVAENVILGLPEPRFWLSTRLIEDRIAGLAERFGLVVEPSALIRQLSIGERQRVEILKLLYRDTRILILDEPTSVLTPRETEHLFGTLRQITASGRAVVFISHKMDEVMAVSDRITVLRGGRTVDVFETRHTTARDLAAMMLGEVVIPPRPPREGRLRKGTPALLLEGIRAAGDRGGEALRGIDLTLAPGEIFGLVGIAGNGQKEMAEVVTGLRKPTAGRIAVAGRDLTGAGPRRFIESGVGHVPEDRLGSGVVAGMSLAENLVLKGGAGCGAVPPGDPSRREEECADLIARFGVSPPDPRKRAGDLSGGNIQRLILARELSANPCLLVAVYPFRGLDVAASEFLGRALEEAAAAGLAVLLVVEDIELALGLCDRIGVIFRGTITGTMPSDEATAARLGLLMAGERSTEATA
jgi:ABC-type uncharacterized transport system ATPase subunit